MGDAYLDATSHAYGADAEGVPAAPDFRARVAEADAFVHVQDLADQDVLGADAFAEHEGGFAAAAASLGNSPALYHADTTTPDTSKIRTLREEVARTVGDPGEVDEEIHSLCEALIAAEGQLGP